MHPELFKIFSFPIHSYGLMLAVSFLFGIWLSSSRAKKKGLNPDVIADVGFWVILSAIVGARLYFVMLHPEEFKGNLQSIFNPFQKGQVGIGGLVMYGGFIGAIVSAFLYFKIKKQPFLPYADAIAPSVGIGIFLTRIGCFLNGCCYGASSTGACSVSFPHISPAGDFQQHIHATGLYPSQLFESAGGLVMALIVLGIGNCVKIVGFQFYLIGIMYTILRFAVDFSRHYELSEKVGPLSHNQIVCIVLFVLFSVLLVKQAGESKKEAPATPVPGDGIKPSSPDTTT